MTTWIGPIRKYRLPGNVLMTTQQRLLESTAERAGVLVEDITLESAGLQLDERGNEMVLPYRKRR